MPVNALLYRSIAMMEMIVLGDVPGTQAQITVSWALIAAAIFLIAIDSYLIYQRRHSTGSKNTSKSSRSKARPA